MVNIKNNYNECFKWCILYGFCILLNKILKEFLKNKNNLNLIDGIEFPVKLKDICRFEKKSEIPGIIKFSASDNALLAPWLYIGSLNLGYELIYHSLTQYMEILPQVSRS